MSDDGLYFLMLPMALNLLEKKMTLVLQKDGLLLEEQVCFQLYLASRSMSKAYHPLLEGIGLTYPQYLVMLVLWEHKKISVKGIGEKLGLDSGTVSPLIKRMMEKGLILKARDKLDERGVQVSLTKVGVALKVKARCVPVELGETTDFDRDKVQMLLRALKEFNLTLTSRDVHFP